MKIAGGTVITCSPVRNFVTLKLVTDEGILQETERVFSHAYSFADGAMHPGDAPGLGVDIDESLAASFPYQRAYLPVARLMDGTVHDW